MERFLVTILAADLVDYLRLMEAGRAMPASLNTDRKVVEKPLVDHRGRVRGSAGDGLMREFACPVEAVRRAIEIQQEIEVHNTDLPEDRSMWFRIGVNLGDIVTDGGNHLGNAHGRIGQTCGFS